VMLIFLMLAAVVCAAAAFLMQIYFQRETARLQSEQADIQLVATYTENLESLNQSVSSFRPVAQDEDLSPLTFPAAQTDFDRYIPDNRELRPGNRVNASTETTTTVRRTNWPPIRPFTGKSKSKGGG